MDAELRRIADRLAITDNMTQYAECVDGLLLERFAGCFTERIAVDYEAVNGMAPYEMDRVPFTRGVIARMSGFERTQHLMGNHRVTIHDDPDEATCRTYLQAFHSIGDEQWLVGGEYTTIHARGADGWRIRRLRLAEMWQTGNTMMHELARQRGDSGLGRAIVGAAS